MPINDKFFYINIRDYLALRFFMPEESGCGAFF